MRANIGYAAPLLKSQPTTLDVQPEPADTEYSFSGHQTFSLRISWLPKAVSAIQNGEDPFADPRVGIRVLGIGKNMVEALRCWVEFFGVVRFDSKSRVPSLTNFGELVLGRNGYDPYLEDDQTLWLLHWHAVTDASRRYYAWQWICNVHADREFSYSEAILAFKERGIACARTFSDTTLRQHLEVFLGTYVQSRSPSDGRVAEDLLESPLAVLGFIREGEPRPGLHGKDSTYLVDVSVKHTISEELFRYCLHEWWGRFASREGTCSYRDVCLAENSPGRVFRMPEREIHERLQQLTVHWPKEFGLTESNNQRQVRRTSIPSKPDLLLRDIFNRSH